MAACNVTVLWSAHPSLLLLLCYALACHQRTGFGISILILMQSRFQVEEHANNTANAGLHPQGQPEYCAGGLLLQRSC